MPFRYDGRVGPQKHFPRAKTLGKLVVCSQKMDDHFYRPTMR